jgi:hypothetical protein
MDMMPASIERDRKYAWDYFQVHGSQRMTTFNFYITFATAFLAGITAVLQPTINMPLIALAFSVLLCLMSFVFWKFDQRNKMLIHNAEAALKEIEGCLAQPNTPTPAISLFSIDDEAVAQRRARKSFWFWQNFYSYSNCFNLLFALFSLMGVAGIIFSLISLF